MMPQEKFRIRDPVHGLINFNELEKTVIDNAIFQRLRNINQLGWTHLVYPGATHKRFEHSIGVMYLSSKVLDHLYYHQRDKKTKEIMLYSFGNEGEYQAKRQIFRIASLLHDIGHSPFSHSGEELFKIEGKEKHEQYTISLMKRYLPIIIDEVTDRRINTYNITTKELIDTFEKKGPLMNEILSGTIDVDRADYLLRDSLHLGVEYGKYDLNRLIDSIIIQDSQGNEYGSVSQLQIENGGKETAFSFLMARYLMFSQVYFHKTRRIMDIHFIDAMKDILSSLYGEPYYPSLKDLDEFIKLDDPLILVIIKKLYSLSDPCRRLLDRDHFRCIYNLEGKDKKDEMYLELEEYLKIKNIPYRRDEGIKKSYQIGSLFIKEKDGNSVPLESYYPSLENITAIFKRIYVPKENREEVLTWKKNYQEKSR
jgi:HD superfamily phosphohydrolase